MEIVIEVKNEKGEVLGKRSSFDWEGAEENLGKLERCFKKTEHYDNKYPEITQEEVFQLEYERERELNKNKKYGDI